MKCSIDIKPATPDCCIVCCCRKRGRGGERSEVGESEAEQSRLLKWSQDEEI